MAVQVETKMGLHACEFLPPDGVYIEQMDCDQGGSTWMLVIYREATEEDLENNHYLEMVGETLWQSTVEVAFCPYCGERLSSGRPVLELASPEHIDFSS